jgi:hypothetical protein
MVSIVRYGKKVENTAVRELLFHSILQLIVCIDFHGLRLLHKIFTFLSILVSGLSMLYHNFYFTLLLLCPFDKAWSQVFI